MDVSSSETHSHVGNLPSLHLEVKEAASLCPRVFVKEGDSSTPTHRHRHRLAPGPPVRAPTHSPTLPVAQTCGRCSPIRLLTNEKEVLGRKEAARPSPCFLRRPWRAAWRPGDVPLLLLLQTGGAHGAHLLHALFLISYAYTFCFYLRCCHVPPALRTSLPWLGRWRRFRTLSWFSFIEQLLRA